MIREWSDELRIAWPDRAKFEEVASLFSETSTVARFRRHIRIDANRI